MLVATGFSMSEPLRHFRDLRTYQFAVKQVQSVYELTRSMPPCEQLRLADQLIRSSRAVPAMIAEAWGRRGYTRAFRDKLSQALAESMEVQVWLECARNCGYVSDEDFQSLDSAWQNLGGMIRRMMQEANRFSSSHEKK